MSAIEIKNLTKYYGKSRGIIDLSFKVERGDFFGFIGPNGAGKSTTIRLLLSLINPTSGEAYVLGKNVKTNPCEILKKVGYLPSDTSFYKGMKVKEILKLSANLRGIDCSEEAENLCRRLDLDVNRKIDELSLGNRKKVGIVCALQHKPELYILDEPTSGLDPLIQHEFYTILQERNNDGATVFLSSHVLSEVARYCKNAAIIRDGKLLALDSVSNLSQSDIKRVTLKGATLIPESDNIRDLKVEDGITSFLYSGKPQALIKELAALDFEDVTVTDPDLEEVFMHYYKKEGDE